MGRKCWLQVMTALALVACGDDSARPGAAGTDADAVATDAGLEPAQDAADDAGSRAPDAGGLPPDVGASPDGAPPPDALPADLAVPDAEAVEPDAFVDHDAAPPADALAPPPGDAAWPDEEGPGALAVDPLWIEFCGVPPGESARDALTLTNVGGRSITLDRVGFSDEDDEAGPSDPAFRVIAGDEPGELLPGEHRLVEIELTRPEGARGIHVGYLLVESDAPDGDHAISVVYTDPVGEGCP